MIFRTVLVAAVAFALVAVPLAVARGVPGLDASKPLESPEHVGATEAWSPAAALRAAAEADTEHTDGCLPATRAEQLAEERALHDALNAVEARLADDLHMLVTFALAMLDLDPRATLSVLGVGDTAEYHLVPISAGAS